MSAVPDNWMPVRGVMWCAEHDGVADECNDGEVCDMAGADFTECDLRDLFYGPSEASC